MKEWTVAVEPKIEERESERASDRELAARFLASPDEFREAYAQRCLDLLRRMVREIVYRKGWCPRSTHRDTFAADAAGLAVEKFCQGMYQLKSPEKLYAWLGMIARAAVVEEIRKRETRIGAGVAFFSLDELIEKAPSETAAATLLEKVEKEAMRYQSRYFGDPSELLEEQDRNLFLGALVTRHAQESDEGAECAAIIGLQRDDERTIKQIATLCCKSVRTVHRIIRANMDAYRALTEKIVQSMQQRMP